MKRFNHITRLLCLLPLLVFSNIEVSGQITPPPLRNDISLGGSHWDRFNLTGQTVWQTSNKDLFVAGHTYSSDGDIEGSFNPPRASNDEFLVTDVFAYKIDWRTGEPAWIARAIGSSAEDYCKEVAESYNGDIYVIFWNSPTFPQYQSGIIANRDDGYVKYNPDLDYNPINSHFLSVVKLDGATGDTLWVSKLIGLSARSNVNSHESISVEAIELSDHTLLIAGAGEFNNVHVRDHHGADQGVNATFATDIVLLNMNPEDGTVNWTSRSLGSFQREDVKGLYETPDSNVIVVAESQVTRGAKIYDPNDRSNTGDVHGFRGDWDINTNIPINRISDVWLVKYDIKNKDTLWTKTIGGTRTDRAANGQVTEEGDLIIAGTTNSNDVDFAELDTNDLTYDSWMMRIKGEDGSTQWTRTFESSGVNSLSISTIIDGDVVGFGTHYATDGDFDTARSGVWGVKVDATTGAVNKMVSNFGYGPMPAKPGITDISEYADGEIVQGSTSPIHVDVDDCGRFLVSGWLLVKYPPNGRGILISGGGDWRVLLDDSLNIIWEDIRRDENYLDESFAGRGYLTPDGGMLSIGEYTGGYQDEYFYYNRVLKYEFSNTDFTHTAPVCVGQEVEFTDNSALSDSVLEQDKWHWDFGDGRTDTGKSTSNIYYEPGEYEVTMSVGDASPCIFTTKTKTINILGALEELVNLGNDTVLCEGDSLFLDAFNTQVINYQWNDGDTNSGKYGFAGAGIYVVAVDDDYCGDVDSIIVGLDTLNPQIMRDTVVCAIDSLALWASGGSEYLWIPSTGLNDSSLAHPISNHDSSITYSVQISNVCGFNYTDSVRITLGAPKFLDQSDNLTVLQGDSVQINVTSDDSVSYRWYPLEGINNATLPNPMVRPLETTTYSVVITGENGCTDTAQIEVRVVNNVLLFIPNAFSPNNDGQNDLFTIQLVGGEIDCFDLSIHDRFGKKVYEQDCSNIPISWDGTYKNKKINPGVYVYRMHISFKQDDLEDIQQTGNVTLIR